MELEDLRVYNIAMELAEKIWKVVDHWNYFAKDTTGKQLGESRGFNCCKSL
jgi:hypothetical protein